MNGYVYFISAGAGDRIKIGFTTNPRSRIAALSTAVPEALTVLSVRPGTRNDEAQFHRRFGVYRLSGEWFSANEHLAVLIAEMPFTTFEDFPPTVVPAPVSANGRAPLADDDLAAAISETLHRVTEGFDSPARSIAEAVGANPSAVKHWLSGKHPPSGLNLIRLAKAYPEVWETVMRLAGRDGLRGVPGYDEAVSGLQKMLAFGDRIKPS